MKICRHPALRCFVTTFNKQLQVLKRFPKRILMQPGKEKTNHHGILKNEKTSLTSLQMEEAQNIVSVKSDESLQFADLPQKL